LLYARAKCTCVYDLYALWFEKINRKILLTLVFNIILLMHRYLHCLLSDIQAAYKADIDEELTFLKSFEEEMKEVERYIRGYSEQPLSYYTKLHKEMFPSAERLYLNEMKTLLETFISMLKTWNAKIDFPEKMPLEERYEFLRNNI